MTDEARIQGELQAQIMSALWELGRGTVEQVRAALPASNRSAYTTVQTVLNRLAERGLLTRDRGGVAIVYCPVLTEAEYLSRAIGRSLSDASADARQAVLAQLVGGLNGQEVNELRRLARRLGRERETHRK